MTKTLILIGCILAGLSVALGAMAAHWLKANISIDNLNNFDTAVRYQMYHALAILFMAALPDKFQIKLFHLAWRAFLIGAILFSGSIYLLATRELTGFQLSWIGPLTPIGGILFLTGWILLLFTTIRVMGKNTK